MIKSQGGEEGEGYIGEAEGRGDGLQDVARAPSRGTDEELQGPDGKKAKNRVEHILRRLQCGRRRRTNCKATHYLTEV